MSHQPGADELRMRAILRKHHVGPDPAPVSAPPRPTARPRDWLDDIIKTDLAPAAPPPPAEQPKPTAPPKNPAPAKTPAEAEKRKKHRNRPGPDTPHTPWDSRPEDPRQSLADAWDRIPYRLKWLAYHGSAAYLGWTVGLVGYATYVTAWIADTGLIGPQAIFWYVAAGATALLYRRTRSWWRPIAWLAAVPATSTIAGVLLYAPTQ
ncbi:hypothetical protein [Streptomyces sp. ALI-76-A]|uniref:hypothetical protein n=1 Tax=Streptomyces sp. ALI-76-A TaxID=3025736 RepID=UPI00256F2D11|nr:hypothetical protein [Streptomyces sp. ALI-76-A]MDL5205116.1 hypothetical protein [Streptomyces sp. ALI-76-A]